MGRNASYEVQALDAVLAVEGVVLGDADGYALVVEQGLRQHVSPVAEAALNTAFVYKYNVLLTTADLTSKTSKRIFNA